MRVEARHIDLKNQRWVFPKSESKNKRTVRVIYLTDEALAISRRLMVLYPDGRLFRNARGDAWTNYAVQCAFRRVRARIGKMKMQERRETVSDRAIDTLASSLVEQRKNGSGVNTKAVRKMRAEAKRKLTESQAITLATRYSLYALRHAWATRALQQGIDALTVSILMGHKDPGTLAKVYQHLNLNPAHLLSELKRVAD